VDREGLSEAEAQARAEAEARELAGTLDATPLAVASSDAPELRGGGADLIATYRNVGDLHLWGFDASVQWFLGSRWEIAGTYSYVSDDWFDLGESEPLALNAPRHKGTAGLVYRDEPRGFQASARVRYTGSFPFLSTAFDGSACRPGADATAEPCIDAYALVDLTLGYRIPGTPTTVQLGVSNLLDESYRSFVGAPATGRLGMLRVTYDLF
jgi:iron complex outermembrane receptor protein